MGIWPIKAQKSPDESPHPSPKHKNKHICQGGNDYGALAAAKWTNTSLKSKEIFFFLRYSIRTVVYPGTKLLGGSHEPRDAAFPSDGLYKASSQVSPGPAYPSGPSRR